MLTFKGIQDAVLERFSEDKRSSAKEWINFVYGQIWGLEEWTFKSATALVTVTAGSQVVSNLPADIGIPHLLQNSQGTPLAFIDWREFQLRYYGWQGSQLAYEWTIQGEGVGAQVFVGPPSNETSSTYQLLYERERGFYPSTALTGAASLPSPTLPVSDTSQAPTSGTCLIAGRVVTYTGKTSTTLTGCSGGTGSFAAGETVVFLSPQAGELSGDTDVPLLPPETHQVLVHAAQAVGQTGENDYTVYMSDDRVQQALDAMRRRYLPVERGDLFQWGSYTQAHFESAGAW